MPNKKNFSEVTNVKNMEVNPEGWVSPLVVEYGLGFHLAKPSYFWRVEGTTHTFVIPIVRLEFLSGGEYKAHFEEALTGFRGDYLEWRNEGFQVGWQKEYHEEYSKFIL